MLQWKLVAKLHKNPKPIRLFYDRNSYHPLMCGFADRDVDIYL